MDSWLVKISDTQDSVSSLLILYLPHYELTLEESVFYIFLKVNSPNNDIEKEFFEKFIATSRYELFPKWERWKWKGLKSSARINFSYVYLKMSKA